VNADHGIANNLSPMPRKPPNESTAYAILPVSVLHQLDQKIIYLHYDFKHLTEKYFEIGMKLDDFLIQLVKYCMYSLPNKK